MALWAKNKEPYSVAFTEDAADQTLLAALEKELTLTKYQTFSNLCKQALWQFLSVSESAQPTPSFQRLEQRIAELQVKFGEFELSISAEEMNRLDGLERHLTQLGAQLEQLQASVNHKFAQVSMVVESKGMESQSIMQPALEPEVEVEVSRRESDPLLERLSSLLAQDF